MANVGSDSSFCTRRKTSKKRTSAGMSSSELQYICDIRFPQFEKMFEKNMHVLYKTISGICKSTNEARRLLFTLPAVRLYVCAPITVA